MEPSGAPWRVLDVVEPEAAAEPGPRPFPWPAVAAAAVAAAVALGAFLLTSRSDPMVGVEGALPPGTEVFDTPPSTGAPGRADVGELVVEVGGAVGHPGVYRLPAGARVGDAIAAAGGYAARVDAAEADRRLNLAAPLRDGEEVHVPARGETAAQPAGGRGPGGSGDGELIDVNAASAEQLDTLPGIGPATAAKIITAREGQRFASVDELRTRKVVGEATLEKIRALITVGP